MDKAYINEIFYSIQGEGSLIGYPFLFIRFCECNLSCNYCDTKKSWKKSKFVNIFYDNKIEKYKNPIDVELLFKIIKNYKFNFISFTGGEPLQSEFITNFLPYLNNKIILIETNGTLESKITDKMIDRINYWAVDWKLKSVIEFDLTLKVKKFLKILFNYNSNIILKVIFNDLTTREEILEIINFINENKNNKSNIEIIFQPITKNKKIILGKNIKHIFEIFQNNNLNFRIIPQVHKILNIK